MAKDKKASRRFFAARIAIGEQLTGWYEVAFTNAQIWAVAMTRPVTRVNGLGVDFDYWPDVALPGEEDWSYMSSEGWYWDEAAGLLYVWHASSYPPNHASGDAFVVDSYLYLADVNGLRSGEDPEIDPDGHHEYHNRIEPGGSVSHKWDDALAGVLSVAESSISIINADGWFNQFLGSTFSLGERDVRVWYCIDSLDNIARIYDGRISTVNVSGDKVVIGFYDDFAALNQPCYMGDTSNMAVMRRTSGSYSALTPGNDGLPRRYIAGVRSYVKYKELYSADYGTRNGYDPIEGEVAFCSDYSPNKATSTNRTWQLCRLPADGILTQVATTIQAETQVSTLRFLRFASHNLVPGDWFQFVVAGNTYFSRVLTIGSFTKSAVSYNCMLIDYDVAYPAATGGTINLMSIPFVWVKQGDNYHHIQPSHFTRYTGTLDSGNKYIYITFINNFEFYYGMTALDPDADTVYFGIQNAADTGAAAVCQRVLESAGMTVNAASVATADAALGIDAHLSIPTVGESEYRTAREYLQDLLKSMGAYAKVNADREVEIKLLEAPAAGETVTDREILGSVSIEHDYDDVAYELNPINEHVPTADAVYTSDSPNTLATDDEAKALHRNSRALIFKHVLSTITDRIEYLLSLRSGPRRTYKFKTATIHADAVLGDNVTLVSDQVPGGSVDLKISGIERSADSVTTTAVEIP